MNIFNFKVYTWVLTVSLSLCNYFVTVRNFKFNFTGAISVNFDFSIITDNLRCDCNTGSTVKIKVKMRFFNTDKSYITINTAVESKIGNLRINIVVR